MKRLHNEKGLTLAELLAVIAISGIIIVFIMSIHIFVQKQYKSQSIDARHLTDVTIAAKAITTEIRTKEVTTVEQSKIVFENGPTYELVNNVLKKDDADYIYEIAEFILDEENDKISLRIVSTTGQQIETEIMIR